MQNNYSLGDAKMYMDAVFIHFVILCVCEAICHFNLI